MKIVKCNDIYSVDSISMQDIIYGKAMLNKASTVGTVASISAIFTSIPIDQELDLSRLNELFQGGENINTPQNLVEFIDKLKDEQIYPLDRLDDFLTHYANQYLLINQDKGWYIDSVFTDLGDLFQKNEVTETLSCKRMIKFFSKLFFINYNNRDRLREILEEEKEEDTTLNRLLYPIPVIVINPVCGLHGYDKLPNGQSMVGFRNFLNSNEITRIVCQNDSFYPILEEIRSTCNEFDELGYITLFHRPLETMKFGIVSNKVFHKDNGTYYLTK